MRPIRSLVLLLALAACGGDGATTTPPPQGPSTTTPPPTAAMTTTTATAATTTTATTAPTLAGLTDGHYTGLIRSVNPVNANLSFDPVTWTWTGPADTEGYWANDDQTLYLLTIADGAVVMACPSDMAGSFPPMLYCQPDEFVAHTIDTLAQWVVTGIEVGQNRRWMTEIPGHNGQIWTIEITGGVVVEIDGAWWP